MEKTQSYVDEKNIALYRYYYTNPQQQLLMLPIDLRYSDEIVDVDDIVSHLSQLRDFVRTGNSKLQLAVKRGMHEEGQQIFKFYVHYITQLYLAALEALRSQCKGGSATPAGYAFL